MLFKLAKRNVFRQKARTAMTLTAIIFGVAGLILSGGFVQDVFVQLAERIIHSQTGHIQVFRGGFYERGTRQPEKFLISGAEKLSSRLAALPNVEQVSARLSFSGLLNNGRRDLPIVGEGIEPDKEAVIGTYIQITNGRSLTDSDRFGMMVGEGVAQNLGLKTGDQATLLMNTAQGALNTLDFEVVGIFQSFSKDFDARAVRIPLNAAQQLMNTGGANLLVVALDHTDHTDTAHANVTSLLEGLPLEARNWRQLSDFYEKTVQLYDRQFGVLQFIILVMVLLSVVNSVNMGAFERLSEFGTMQALGTPPRGVFRLLLAENVLLGGIGATLGVVVGVLLALVISAIGISMPPPPNANVGYIAYIRLDPGTIAMAFLVGFIATILASIIPARRASRMPVVDALRQSI